MYVTEKGEIVCLFKGNNGGFRYISKYHRYDEGGPHQIVWEPFHEEMKKNETVEGVTIDGNMLGYILDVKVIVYKDGEEINEKQFQGFFVDRFYRRIERSTDESLNDCYTFYGLQHWKINELIKEFITQENNRQCKKLDLQREQSNLVIPTIFPEDVVCL